MQQSRFPGVYEDESRLYTKRKGKPREWDPRHSKLSSFVKRGGRIFPFEQGTHVLYLGAASGTTAGHVADIVRPGSVYCVEVSPRSFRDLVVACEEVDNMIPIMGDARRPGDYIALVGGVSVVYQDIAQRDQAFIFLKNVEAFLQPGDICFLMVKARSIDVTAKPAQIYEEVKDELKDKIEIMESVDLRPFEKDHMAIVGKVL
jgi:fibrillarin-like pre-rRNA processing protein